MKTKVQKSKSSSASLALLCALLVGLLLTFAGCSNPAKAKAEHLSRGEAFLKDKKFQEAALEFRNVVQLDDALGDGHWGLARAYEGLERFQESIQEMQRAIDLDPNNLDARIRLGNYYLVSDKKTPEMIENAEHLAGWFTSSRFCCCSALAGCLIV